MRLTVIFPKVLHALIWVFFLYFCLFGPGPTNALDADQLHDFQNLIGSSDALIVTDPRGSAIYAKNADKKLVPASTLKIFTALVALHYLGLDYRFTTEFYLDQNKNLKIKGYGDPLLISEVVAEIATTLSTRLKQVNDIVLDDSYFSEPLTIPGISSSSEPYDAPNGALCVNFNTVNFKKVNGTYISAEPQTPLLPFALERIKTADSKAGRIVFSHDMDMCTLYAGHLFRYFLKKKGIQTGSRIRLGRIRKKNDSLIYTYSSRFSLEDIIAGLLEHSNNYTTNQLLIAAGVQAYGPPGTLSKGVQAAKAYAADLLQLNNLNITEGSGISRENKVTAEELHKILGVFAPYRYLLRHEGNEFYKTGTLCGISSRAGYIENPDGSFYRYVVIINTPEKSTGPIMKKLRLAIEPATR
ncbi:MAG: D-alanyl-D-alanine carboxypeptidase [Desulfobacterales bacterium]|jgi:D-alanyl-D-alanine carboxypeptidase/D-alanyl-D-alanine-endopeptidase (penicillin-binding protein 4)